MNMVDVLVRLKVENLLNDIEVLSNDLELDKYITPVSLQKAKQKNIKVNMQMERKLFVLNKLKGISEIIDNNK